MITDERLRLYPRALLFAVVAGFSLALATGRLGGDLAAFYAAGRMVADGRSADLYDWDAQVEAQAGLLAAPGDPAGTFLAFPYPPFVALAYAPLAALDYRVAFAAHTFAMALVLGLAVALLRPLLPRVDRWPWVAFVGLLCFYPMFRAVTGGQNTALSLLILVGCWRALDAERPVLAGAVAALLLFKPQLGLPLLALVATSRPTSLAGAVPVGLGLYVAAAAVAGWGWIPRWWEHVRRFHQVDRGVSASDAVGLLGFSEAVLGPGLPALAAGGVLTGAVCAVLAWIWLRPTWPWRDRFAVTAPALVLLPPHALFYDVGLAGLTLLVLADRRGRMAAGPVGVLYVAAFAAPLSDWSGASLLVPWVVAVCAWAWRSAGT